MRRSSEIRSTQYLQPPCWRTPSAVSITGRRSPISWCSEQAVEATRVVRRQAQISAREPRPFFHRAGVGLEQMSDRQARAQGRPVTPIKREKFLWQAVRQDEARMTLDVFPGPGTAEALAFDAEEGNLVKRIDGAQTAVEFQTVDDSHRIAEPDVFRAQVAVPLHDVTVTDAIGDQDGSLGQKPPLRLVDLSHQSGRQGKTRVKQNTLVVGQAAIPAAEVGLAR